MHNEGHSSLQSKPDLIYYLPITTFFIELCTLYSCIRVTPFFMSNSLHASSQVALENCFLSLISILIFMYFIPIELLSFFSYESFFNQDKTFFQVVKRDPNCTAKNRLGLFYRP